MITLKLEVRHATRYDYTAPVTLAHHLAHLRPLQDAHQRLQAHTLEISPPPGDLREGRDAHGNACTWFSLDQSHASLEVVATSRLEVGARFDSLRAAASPAWDALAQGLRYVSRSPFDPAVEFVLPSPYVPRLPGLRDWAAPSLAPGRPLAEAALALMYRLHHEFHYDSGSTQVDTPLAQAFEQRRGVCQDFAHLLIGALRMHGVPARYVSGYLLTRAAPGELALVGADASHAWVRSMAWSPAIHARRPISRQVESHRPIAAPPAGRSAALPDVGCRSKASRSRQVTRELATSQPWLRPGSQRHGWSLRCPPPPRSHRCRSPSMPPWARRSNPRPMSGRPCIATNRTARQPIPGSDSTSICPRAAVVAASRSSYGFRVTSGREGPERAVQ